MVPSQEAVQKLNAARLASDIMGTPTLILARTDAEAANLLTSDIDERDKAFCTGERTVEGFYRCNHGVDQAISRGLAYAPYADLVWCETGKPDMDYAKKFAEALQKEYPEQLLAYNCSPSFNWKANLDDASIAKFQRELGTMGYKFQFITLAGFHALNHSMFNLARVIRRGKCQLTWNYKKLSLHRKRMGIRLPNTNARLGPGISMQLLKPLVVVILQ